MPTISPICTCGAVLGHIAPYYIAEYTRRLNALYEQQKKLLESTHGADVKLNIKDVQDDGLSMRDYIERLNLDGRECCITALMGHRIN